MKVHLFKTITFLLLLVCGVPWYWSFLNVENDALWFGMPPWFIVAVLVSVVVSCLTAFQFLTPWPGESSTEDSR